MIKYPILLNSKFYSPFQIQHKRVQGNRLPTQNVNMSDKQIDLKHEAYITVALSACTDLLNLISEYLSKRESGYFLQCFFISFRQIAYYFSKHSPLLQCRDKLSRDEKALIDNMVDIRHASAHLEAEQHWLNDYIRISGGMNYKDNDVEIQYGPTKLFLLKDIVTIYKELRKILAQTDELSHLPEHPAWEIAEQIILESEKTLREKLKDPESLLRVKDHFSHKSD